MKARKLIGKAYVTVHINVAESAPKFHCLYGNGAGSVKLADFPIDVYLSGTRSDVVDWARRVIAAAHELPKPEEVRDGTS